MFIQDILEVLVTDQLEEQQPKTFQKLKRPLKPLSGRIALNAKLTDADGNPVEPSDHTGGQANTPMSAVLRIDPDKPFVSGDVFQDRGAFKGPFKLGGRTDWLYSFYGPLRYVIQTEKAKIFVGVCVIVRNQGSKSDPFVQRGAVAITTDLSETQIQEVQFLYFFDRAVMHTWRGQPADLANPIDRLFRRVGLFFWMAPAIKANREHATIVEMLADSGEFSVKAALRSVGIDAKIEFVDDADGSPRSALAHQSDVDWAHIIRFEDFNAGGAHAHSGQDHSSEERGNTIYGITHGLGDAKDRFRSRFQARINIASIVEDAEERGLDFTGPNAALKRKAWQVRHTTVHEFGHLINMPHPWSRETAYDLLDTSMPDAMSWMNYPSLYPLGTITKAHLGRFERKERDLLTAKLSKRFHQKHRDNIAHNAGYTQMEQHFIRHAPLNQIAQGGDTFLDHQLPAPAIKRATHSHDMRLEIVVPTEGALKPAQEVNLFYFDQLRESSEQLPVLPAFVRLNAPHGDGGPGLEMMPELVAGNLQILLRRRNVASTDHWFNNEVARVITIDPLTDKNARKAVLQAAELHAPKIAGELSLADISRDDLVTLPWLELSWLKHKFGDVSFHEFAVQAVLFSGEREHRSEVVRLTYSDVPASPSKRRTVRHQYADALLASAGREYFELSPSLADAHTRVASADGTEAPVFIPELTDLGHHIFADPNQIHLFNMSNQTRNQLTK